jgi:hypothetical protein
MNKDAYTNRQKHRIKNLDQFLQNFKEIDIPSYIIKKINKLYPDTLKYDFLRTEEIEKGIMVRLVDLDLGKIYMPSIIVNIKSTSSRDIGIIVLFNPALKIYWSVNPDKYYIFKIYKKLNRNIKVIKEYADKYYSLEDEES